jgi:LuxR family maltose regulon positive regulatory protein
MRECRDAVQDAAACANSLTQNLPLPHRSMRDYSVLVLAGEKGYDVLRASFGRLIRQDYDILEHCFRAGLHFERGETGAAMSALRSVGDSAKRNPNPELHLGVETLWHLLLTQVEEYSAADKIADGLAAYLEAADAAFLWPNFLAFVYESRMRRGDRAAEREWLDRYAAPHQLFYCRFPQHFTTARALIHSGSYMAATRLLDRLRLMADSYQRPLDLLEADILLCRSFWRLGETDPAVLALDRAVTLARPYGFTRLFAQDTGDLAPVLRLLAHRHKKISPVRHFIERLLAYTGGTADESLKQTRTGLNLSKRQIDLLALLAKGYDTARLAADMDVTPNTLRNHFQRLFRALGVKNRREALRVARGLRLV